MTLTPEELKALAPQRSTVLDLATVVPADEISPLFFDAAFYVQPDGAAAVEPYRVIAAALERGDMDMHHVPGAVPPRAHGDGRAA